MYVEDFINTTKCSQLNNEGSTRQPDAPGSLKSQNEPLLQNNVQNKSGVAESIEVNSKSAVLTYHMFTYHMFINLNVVML